MNPKDLGQVRSRILSPVSSAYFPFNREVLVNVKGTPTPGPHRDSDSVVRVTSAKQLHHRSDGIKRQ